MVNTIPKSKFYGLPVREIMTKDLVMVEPVLSVFEGVKILRDKNIGSLLVMDNLKLVGIFTERDASFKVIAEDLDYKTTVVRDVMTKYVVTVKPETTVESSFLIALTRNVRHLPVLGDAGAVVGMVSMKDLLAEVLKDFLAK